MDMKQISTLYSHAMEKGFLSEGEGLTFLKDIQEGIKKDGLRTNTSLARLIITVSAIPRKINDAELGEMLKTVAFG